MAQEQAKLLLQQGIAAAHEGRRDDARDLLQKSIRLDPQNETSWLWLSSVARDDRERLFCLKQLLALNPHNEFALKGLRALGAAPEETPEPSTTPPPGGVPVLTDDRYARIQQAVDEFLRRFDRHPADQLGIQWTHKLRRRYGEEGERRLRQITYASAAVVGLLIVGGLVALATVAGGLLGSDNPEVAVFNTLAFTPTATGTMTPTPGGATPTPFPQPMNVPPTAVPVGLDKGNPYGNTPTAVYPPVNPNVANSIKGAIAYYSIGAYPDAIGTLEGENKADDPHCYAAVRYYEAMSYAMQGGTRNLDTAARLLQDALAYEPPNPRYSSCQNDPLILAGLAYVQFLQGDFEQAMSLSDEALQGDPRLVQAATTKAAVQLARGEYADARLTLDPMVRELPGDVNLLILAAQIELADNRPGVAVEYIGRALYVEPTSQPALQLQARAYLALAAQTSDPAQQIEYFGLAVISAQTLLLYYSGDPAGYLYLAQARIGEGNYALADVALTRIIDLESRLPESAAPIIEDAYRARGDLYYREGRLKAAREDLDQVINVSNDPSMLSKLVNIALAEADYAQAQDRLDQLLELDLTNKAYLLLQARLLVEICTYFADIRCEHNDVLNTLQDSFLSDLSDSQLADAYSYRAQARYHLTVERRSLTEDERQSAYQLALADVNHALALRDSAIDRYYRGLIMEELGRLPQALEEYQWVLYWNEYYQYPFVERNFEDRVANVMDEMEAATLAATATAAAQTATAEATLRGATRTPVPTGTRAPTATRTPSPTPVPATPEPTMTLPHLP
jgi:tetratricopeptide (TPR) repeat protein